MSNIIKQDVQIDNKGNWLLHNVWNAGPLMEHAKAMRELDPYIGKYKGGRRLGCIPMECWNDPTQIKLRLAKEAEENGDRQSAMKYMKDWLRDNPEYMYVDVL